MNTKYTYQTNATLVAHKPDNPLPPEWVKMQAQTQALRRFFRPSHVVFCVFFYGILFLIGALLLTPLPSRADSVEPAESATVLLDTAPLTDEEGQGDLDDDSVERACENCEFVENHRILDENEDGINKSPQIIDEDLLDDLGEDYDQIENHPFQSNDEDDDEGNDGERIVLSDRAAGLDTALLDRVCQRNDSSELTIRNKLGRKGMANTAEHSEDWIINEIDCQAMNENMHPEESYGCNASSKNQMNFNFLVLSCFALGLRLHTRKCGKKINAK